MIPDIFFWKSNDTTQYILKKLDEEIENVEKELTSGILITSSSLEREYCRATGYLDGLKFIKSTIKEVEDEQQYESTRGNK